MKNLCISLLMCISICGSSQNLVKNPSFEEYEICPAESASFDGYVKSWTTYFTTPDYFNLCDYYPWYADSISTHPRTGDGIAFCCWYKNPWATNIFREYIHGELISPLIANELYYTEYYINVDYGVAIDKYQVHFSTTPIVDTPEDGILPLEPHISNQHGVITENKWTKISGCYQATGGEQFLVLGNFASNLNTEIIYIQPNAQSHFTMVDDVAVYKISTLIPNDTLIIEGEAIPLPDYASQQYYYQDSLLTSNVFQPSTVGLYTIEVHLEECGKIGEFDVEVVSCIEQGETFISILAEYSEVCLEDMPTITFLPQDCCEYYLDDVLWTDLDFAPTDTGIYEILVRIPDCADLETYTLVVESCALGEPVRENNCFYFPNVFSPNFDGINDEFRVFGDCEILNYQLDIFNRWGGHVFTTGNQNNGWNGRQKNRDLEVGVFIYTAMIEYLDEDEIYHQVRLSGDVMVLR